MANELKFGNKVVFLNGLPLTLPIAASDPGSAVAGDLYYNSVSNNIHYYNGSSWSPLASGGAAASTALDNLSGVAINASLLPGVDNSINLGSASKSWSAGYIHSLNDASDIASIAVYSRQLKDSTGATQIDWSSGVLFSQLTASTVPYLDASKKLVSSSVTPTELGYLSGVTSAIQTQLNGKANQALDNLASTAVNVDILPGVAAARNLGSSTLMWNQINSNKVIAGGEAVVTFTGTLTPSSNVIPIVGGSTAGLAVGQYVSGSGIPDGSTIASIVTNTSVTISPSFGSVTGSGNTSLQFLFPLAVRTENRTGTDNSSAIFVRSGNSATQSGEAIFKSGNTTANGSKSGDVYLLSGTAGGTGSTRGNAFIGGASVKLDGGNGGGKFYSGLDILPAVSEAFPAINGSDLTKNLGSSSFRWNFLHVGFITADSSALSLNGTSINVNNLQINNLADPTSAQDAVTKSWVSNLSNINAANRQLSNLDAGNVAINAALIPDTDNLYTIGSSSFRWQSVNALSVDAGSSQLSLNGSSISANSKQIKNLAAGSAAADAVRYDQVMLLSGVNSMAADMNMGGFKVTNAADPVNPGDLVNLQYFNNFMSGVAWKEPVLVATTANITLSGEQTIDGVLTSASRVLVKNQTAPANNGIYVSGAGAWSRAVDMDSWSEVPSAAVFVEEGTLNADIGFVCTSDPGGTLGTTAINFVQFSSAGAYSADNVTLQLISGVFSVKNGGISNAQVNAAAAIAYSKLALSNSIVNADIASGAAIAYNKLAVLTANRALQSDGSGFVSASSVTNTELGYLSGVTSAIQSQIDGKANKALDNLVSTAVNADIIPATDLSVNLGSSAKRWTALFASSVDGGASALNLKTSASNASVVINANGTGNLDIEATKIRRSQNGADSSNFMEDQYLDSLSLSANVSAAAEISASLSFAVASFDSAVINYVIKEATSNKTRIGQFIVSSDGTISSSSDQFSETAALGSALGLSLSADISGGNVRILYNNTHATNAATMRAHIRRFRA